MLKGQIFKNKMAIKKIKTESEVSYFKIYAKGIRSKQKEINLV